MFAGCFGSFDAQDGSGVFDLVAVSPTGGNAASAKQRADAVLKSMTGMGLPQDRVSESATSPVNVEAVTSSSYVGVMVRRRRLATRTT